MSVGARRAAVLGSPIAHSLSPVLHRAAYDALGLTGWTYDAYDVDTAGLGHFLAGLGPEWAGLSLTMPLKAAVLPLLDRSSPLVQAVGGANTVLLGADGTRAGENTDVPGMVAALRERGVSEVRRGCVLGGGATAAAALAALRELGEVEPVAVVRDLARSEGLAATAHRLDVRLTCTGWDQAGATVAGADVVVSTTPPASTDTLAAHLAPGLDGLLLDVVYDPWPTRLAQAWVERGGTVLGGLDLLVHQAALQVPLMTGLDVDVPALVPVLRAAGEQALGAR